MTGRAAPRVLLALPQFPHDPASGAARTVTTIGEMLAAAGFLVHSVGTTTCEGDGPIYGARLLADAGIRTAIREAAGCGRVINYCQRGVEHFLVDAGATAGAADWRLSHGAEYDALYARELAAFRPEVLFTYGGHPDDLLRRRQASAGRCRVVFGLFNANYMSVSAFAHVDAVLTPSRFLADLYRGRLGLDSTPVPTPLWPDDVVAIGRSAERVTFVNPSVGKGAMLVARLAEEIGTRHPGVTFEVFESRASGRLLVQAGFVDGFDLRRHPNVLIRPPARRPADVLARTRIGVVPSVCQEASSRIVAEALVNGIPVIVSDRGGLPENAGDGGIVIPLPADLTMKTRRPVGPLVVRPWLESIEHMYQDSQAYAIACDRARSAGQRFQPSAVAPQYVEFFQKVISNYLVPAR